MTGAVTVGNGTSSTSSSILAQGAPVMSVIPRRRFRDFVPRFVFSTLNSNMWQILPHRYFEAIAQFFQTLKCVSAWTTDEVERFRRKCFDPQSLCRIVSKVDQHRIIMVLSTQ